LIPNAAYTELAQKFIDTIGSKYGLNAYVALPDFIFETPDPVLIEKYLNQAKKDLKDAGFSGNEFYIAAHSLGTVIT
jgi:hypothetical protein